MGGKIVFESDKIVLTKNGLFVGKGYCNQELFVLNVYEVINGNASTSSAFLIDSVDLWHGRLGHVNFTYIKKMKDVGLLSFPTYLEYKECSMCI